MARPKLTIVRGLPGSGKSTYAQKTGKLVVEADMFRVQADGSYVYDSATDWEVHRICEELVGHALVKRYSVVVSNTFILNKWLNTYIQIGLNLMVDIEIVEMKTSYGSIHDVPDVALRNMANNWEELAPEWRKYLIE